LKHSHPSTTPNPLRLVLGGHSRGPKKNGKPTWEMPIYPYPTRTGWNPTTATFQPIKGKRGVVDKIAERFRPTAAE
jgi:feruloyl esterase